MLDQESPLDQATSLVYAAKQLLGFDHSLMSTEVSAAVNTTILNTLNAANKIFKVIDTTNNAD